MKKLQKITFLFIFLLSTTIGFAQDIVINEINYNSAPDFDPEDWVELFNQSLHSVDVSNWVFKDDDDLNAFTIPPGTIMNPGTYLVLTKDLAAFQTLFPGVSPVIGDMGFGLSKKGELIRLFNDAEIIIDQLEFDDNTPWPTEPDGDGNSLELIHPSLDNELATSWAASNASAPHGTPGAQNSVYTIGLFDFKQVQFSMFPNPMQNETTINIANEYSISSGKIIIFNILGKAVKSFPIHTNKITINRENLSAGVYIVNITSNKGFFGSKRLIVH